MNDICTPEFNDNTRRLRDRLNELRRVDKAFEDGDFGPLIRSKAKALIELDVTDANKIVDEVHKYVNQYAEHSKQEVANEISGYGKKRAPSEDPIAQKLTALKAELRDLQKTQDEITGKTDPDAVKKRARKTALANEIAELDRQIDHGENAEQPARTPLSTPDIDRLRKLRDEKKQELSNLRPSPPATLPADPRVALEARRRTGLEKEIANLNRQLKDGADQKRPDYSTSNADIEKLKQLRDEKKRQLKNLEPSPPAIYPKDPSIERNARRQKQLESQIANLQKKLEHGDTSRPGKKQPYQYNEATRHAELERNRLKQQVDELIAKGDRMNQSAGKKILGMVHNLQMGALLASIHVFKKLGYAVGGGHAMSLAADVSRSIAKHVIPGVKSVAEKSSQYGTGLDLDALKARFQGVKEAPKEALNQLKHGSASRELLGGIGRASDEYFTFAGTLSDALHTPGLLNRASETVRALSGYVGRTHAAEKEFLAQPEYREGLVRENKFMVKQLEAQGKTPEQIAEFMGRESTQAAAGVKALERAYESKMQGKNPVNAAFDAWVGTLDRSNNLGANFAGFLFKTIFPVRKIGVNVVKQGSSLAFGGIKAAVSAMSKEGITPERANYIMKNIGQQGAGASALAIGILYYNKFGGVPGVFSKREQPQNKDSEGKPIRAGEGDGFGSEAFHGAPLAMLQVGASMAQVFHKEFGEKGTDLALDVVLKPSLNWFLRTVPYTDQARRMINTAEFGRGRKGGIPSALGEIAGNTARGMVVPGAVQQYAAASDPSHYYRQPRNFVEDIKTGIPGLREQVPTGNSRRPDK